MIGYRAMLEGDNEAHGGAEVVRAKLAFMEQKIYAGTEGVVADTILTKWLAEFDASKAKSVMTVTAKQAAGAANRAQRGDHRVGGGRGGDQAPPPNSPGNGGKVKQRTMQEYVRSRKGAWRAGGASSEALQWIARGAKMRWVKGHPPKFDHGTSLRDLKQQQEWLDIEMARSLKTGAWVRARRRRHVSRVFLVPKPGTNSWRLVMDFRWLNEFCVRSKCKMETLKKLRRLASQGFTFDFKDGYHAVGIDPDFQEFMQFDTQGVLYQCGALPFGWTDSPRIFVKLMKTLVELIRSPQAGEDRHEVKKLRDGQEVRRRWAVRRREGGLRRGSDRAGARVLPYMDDFMVITKTQDDAFVQRDQVSKLLPRLGLFRNEKKGHWEPTQLVEHLGLEVDFEEGLFRVTERRLKKIHSKATAILCRATREQRWVQARELAVFNGLCQSVYLAVPTSRLYLRELYSVLGKKNSWGSKKEARGLWNDELQKLHSTHLELEAVYKTVRSFLFELEGKVVRLYCDNQAVVAMLSHFTSRNPELVRRMRKLWLLLDLHDIELQARYIRSEANEWADRLSRDKDLDDWRINKKWFNAWHDPGSKGVDSLAYDWRGEHNWVNPPWGLIDEVAHKLREEGASATVVAPYWPGQSWFRELEALAAEVEINKPEEEVRPGCKIEVLWPEDQAWYPRIVGATGEDGRTKIQYDDGDEENVVLKEEKYRVFPSENEEEDPQQQVTATPWKTVLLRHWTEKLGNNQHSDTAAAMQAAALEKLTADNYEGQYKKFVKFCTEENLRWLPATAATVQLYMAALQKAGTVKGTSLQPYLLAINSFHEDFDYPGPAKGRAVTRAVKGMTAMQTAAAEQQNVTETVRTYLPASAVRCVHKAALQLPLATEEQRKLFRACVYVVVAFVTFGKPQTGTAMLRESLLRDSNGLSIVLEKEKGKNHLLCKRRLCIPREGVAELHELLDRWEQTRDDDWLQAATTSTAKAADTASYWRLPCDKKKQFKNVDANEWIACALGHVGYTMANEEKQRLEEKQRAARKKLESGHYQEPNWFKKVETEGDTETLQWQYLGSADSAFG
ncbi:hypothetical protein CYMTET_47546 [Cymbomonas tetramitiformis]|uniref:Reverse transcriptase domain-containing protein n=1 Tax=Cymbomonas tetramitiformis TaxID=36881 RepID=A0AAE0BVY9_9CHLO|nr:hypothetical protein CYMTET_47546 [Cymbomonas tetramitiformis]